MKLTTQIHLLRFVPTHKLNCWYECKSTLCSANEFCVFLVASIRRWRFVKLCNRKWYRRTKRPRHFRSSTLPQHRSYKMIMQGNRKWSWPCTSLHTKMEHVKLYCYLEAPTSLPRYWIPTEAKTLESVQGISFRWQICRKPQNQAVLETRLSHSERSALTVLLHSWVFSSLRVYADIPY